MPALSADHQHILELHKAGRLDEADAACQALLGQHPNDPDALALAAATKMRQGKPADAETLLWRAVERTPEDAPAPEKAQAWLNLGRFLTQAGRWDDAEALYKTALARLPDAPRLHEEAGRIRQRAGDFPAAETAYRRVTDLSPTYAAGWMQLGMTLLRQDRIGEAVATLEKATGLNPKLAAAHGNLGNAYQKQGDLAAAEAAYAKAVELNPKDAQSYVSQALITLRRGDAATAADMFERCLSLMGPERRAAAWAPFALAQSLGHMPGGYRAELGRLIARASLTPPEGYATIDALNQALAGALESEAGTWEPAGKATRGGAQTGLLLDAPREPYIAFETALRRAIDAHFDSLIIETGHPFLGQIPKTYHLDLWGTLLKEGGHQHAHIHVGGWMSGAYYVALPDTLGTDPDSAHESGRAGWIEFGRPPPDFEPAFEPQTLTYEPRAGDALFFPSYAFHRTLPFTGGKSRISLAFDVKPTGWRAR